jgi:hypothetical protein
LEPTPPVIQWVLEVLSPEAKQPGREAEHSPPTSAVVKNTWICTSSPPYVFMVQFTEQSTGTTSPFYAHGHVQSVSELESCFENSVSVSPSMIKKR